MVMLIIKMMKDRCRSCTGPSQLRCKHGRLLGDHVHWGGPCKAWSQGETRGRQNSTFKPYSGLKIEQGVCVGVEKTTDKSGDTWNKWQRA